MMQRWRCPDRTRDTRWVTELEPGSCWVCGLAGVRANAIYITSQHSMVSMTPLDVE